MRAQSDLKNLPAGILSSLSVLLLVLLPITTARCAEPSVQMLEPGFEVKTLPVRITNINNLAFAPDGRLFAAAYNGKVYRLVDTDGDGLEDRAEPYWDRDTIITPVGLAWAPEGLYVSSHRKISLLRDDDHDGRAEREEIIATDWPPIENVGGNVDALGIFRDKEGNLYFGLGCANYANAYQLKDGKPQYDVHSERGTILKMPPDHKSRQIIATGIRFPYAIRMNRQGDLFATDQEGATWLPEGNPLDELNHIIPGRHYGFPPRHDQYLPNVLDEPPVVGFSPQHQSACGMVFNETSAGWKAFGPPAWEGDALVAGFSRGKVWRVALVKTPAGYVGRSTQVAASNMMVADVAVSPAGSLYLTCHSGSPDWGTGPQGEGKLFKISYVDPRAAQPVIAWASGPLEARVAFDQPLDPGVANGLVGQPIAFGEFVRAAGRLEVHKPPYKAVEQQEAAPRAAIKVAAARLDDQGRTLVLTTDPHGQPVTFALTIPSVKALGESGPGATVDLAYDLTGVEASWSQDAEPDKPAWTGWWPHLDPEVVRAWTAGSFPHDAELKSLRQPGRLSLRTLIELPAGQATVKLESSGKIEAALGDERVESDPDSEGTHRAVATTESTGDLLDLSLTVETGGSKKPFALRVSYHTDKVPTERPVPAVRLQVPWAPPKLLSRPPAGDPPPSLAGGDPVRGEEVFFSTQARCSACHKVQGKGGDIGPDLSNLPQRDLVSIFRDINDPSATINPDFISYTVALKNGQVAVGVVHAQGKDAVRLSDTDAKDRVIPRSEIEELRPSSSSIMPAGIVGNLGEAKIRDLLAFLTTEPPKQEGPPPPRTRAEVEKVLGRPQAALPANQAKPLEIVLVATPQDHGPGEHDYPAWQKKWEQLLGQAPGVRISTAQGWPDERQWASANVVVCYFWNHAWTPERYRQLDAFLARGGGLVALHSSVVADQEPERLARRLGLASQPQRTKYRHGPLDLIFTAPADHPITRGLGKLHLVDETYWPLIGDESNVTVLGTAMEEGKARPMLWTYRVGPGRVFATVLGHYSWTYDDPLFRVLVLRGLAWSAGEPTERFEPLATSGVTLSDSR